MHFSSIRVVKGLALTAVAGALVACGGGGGGSSSGGPGRFDLKLSASRTQLPLNIGNVQPSIGGQYTATVFMEAKRENTGRYIEGDEAFSCQVVGDGIERVTLFKLDGTDEEEDINGVKVLKGWQSVTLGANSGGARLYVHARPATVADAATRVGNATVRCSVNDPDASAPDSEDITIRIGGEATGRPAQVVVDKQNAEFLYVQGVNSQTAMTVQADVRDEAWQPVANAMAPNLRIRLLNPVTTQAYLQSGGATAPVGGILTANTIGGKAQFTVHSGSTSETLLIEVAADRADNNVANGITDLVYNLVTVPVRFTGPSGPLTVTNGDLEFVTGEVVAGLFNITGGFPGYTCEFAPGSNLPAGLVLSDCALMGTVTGEPGTYSAVLSVRDSGVVQSEVTAPVTIRVLEPLQIAAPASLPNGRVGEEYANVVFNATGGRSPYSWSYSGPLPPGLSFSNGVLSGKPSAQGSFSFTVLVTDAGGRTAERDFTIIVNP